ncbi:MAG: OB-fold nucleic acid binding domain-containing protein, partial [Flavobacteriaceae bacterium]|nr:OB-fold nucleic acid binding domain-containing protein [Flavobacteriaceae bacterium]
MEHNSVKDLLNGSKKNDIVHVKGWVRTFRANRFIALNDGSTIKNIQCVINYEKFDENSLKRINTGTSLKVSGNLIESLGSGQKYEISVTKLKILGDCDSDNYPIQPKKHSFEFLRENAHLRTRTNTFSAVMRLRSSLSYAIHNYFNSKGFYYVHTPIITSSDAEGAGEQFKVTTLDLNNLPKNQNNEIDFKKDFFGKETSLTVSGQLEAETYA